MNAFVGKLKKTLPLLAVLLALALPLMFVLEDFIRDAIVLPLAYLAWLAGVILGALPQALFISLVVLLGVYVAMRSLGREKKSERTPPPVVHQSVGAVALWLERIGRVSEGAYSRERLNYYLGQLLTRTIAHEQHLSPREVLYALDSGELVLPPEVRAHIDLAYRRGYPTRPRWYQRFVAFLARLIAGRRIQEATPREIEGQISPALSYIERQLRIEPVEVTSEQHP